METEPEGGQEGAAFAQKVLNRDGDRLAFANRVAAQNIVTCATINDVIARTACNDVCSIVAGQVVVVL